jgi:hypothetical protein
MPNFDKLVSGKLREAELRCPEQCYSLDRWHGSLALLRSFLKGWNIQQLGDQKRVKFELRGELQKIDEQAKRRELSPPGRI